MPRASGASSICRACATRGWIARSSRAMTAEKTLGLILAGGLARRMGGGDKPLTKIGGLTILDRVLARMRPQCRALVLNAYAAADSFYRAAVDLAGPSDPERPRLLLALGRARHNTNFAAAPEVLELDRSCLALNA